MPALLRDPGAYLAGLGTTAILTLAAGLLVIAVTSLVAFSEWSPTERGDEAGDLVLKDPPPTDRPARAAPAARAARGAPASAAAAPAPAPAETAGNRSFESTAPTPPSPGTTPRLDDDQPTPPGAGFRAVSPPAAPPAPPPAAAPGRGPRAPALGLQGVTGGLGKATQELTNDLGAVFEPVNPQLGDTLGETGGLLGDLVGDLGAPQ